MNYYKIKTLERQPAGFTLIEVVIAITIFAICISVVYSLYASIVSIVDDVEGQVELDNSARLVIDRISEDLRFTYTGDQGIIIGSQFAADSGGDPALLVSSTAHLVFDPEAAPVDVSLIRYYIRENNETEGYDLFRSEAPAIGDLDQLQLPEGKRHILAHDVLNLEITYIDQEGGEHDTWDSVSMLDDDVEDEKRFPAAYRLTLQLGKKTTEDDGKDQYTMLIVTAPGLIIFEDE